MPLLKMKSMKGLDFSCASPASTAICSSTDQNYMVRNSTKSLNRLNSYLNDHYKTFTNTNNNTSNHHYSSSSPRAPCISELPFTPRLSSSYREKTRKKPPSPSVVKHSDLTPRRKSTADISDVRRRFHHKFRCNNGGDATPPRSNSSRYLLGDSKFLDSLSTSSDSHHHHHRNKNDDAFALIPSTPVFFDSEKERKILKQSINTTTTNNNNNRALAVVNSNKTSSIITKYDDEGINNQNNHKQTSMGYGRNDSLVLRKSSSSGARSRDQVVVLRVSLHCKGCEGKLRKHLSKMEGVSSFSIDLETKKVIVIGNVTPLSVLTSISKVKNAQFWPSAASVSPPSSTSSSTTSSSTVDFN